MYNLGCCRPQGAGFIVTNRVTSAAGWMLEKWIPEAANWKPTPGLLSFRTSNLQRPVVGGRNLAGCSEAPRSKVPVPHSTQ